MRLRKDIPGGNLRTKRFAAAAAAVAVALAALAPAVTVSASSSPTDHGGAVLWDDPAVAPIFWGNWWTTTKQGKSAASEMHRLFQGLGRASYSSLAHDPWTSTLTQYWQYNCPNDPNHANYAPPGPCDPNTPAPVIHLRFDARALTWCMGSPVYSGDCFDKTKPPASPSGAQIGAEINKWDGSSTYEGQAGAIYALFLPPKVVPAQDTTDCAYHTYYKDLTQPSSGIVYYLPVMVIPYELATKKCSAGLGAAAGLSIAAAHEFAETVTNPYGTIAGTTYAGWITADGPPYSEIADTCQNVFVFSLTLPTGTFEVPQLWDNQSDACVQGRPDLSTY